MKTSQQMGFSLVELLIVVVVIGIIASIAVPNMLAARRSSHEASAIATTRVIHSVQATYRTSYPRYGSLNDLQAAGMVDSTLTSASGKNGYSFTVTLISGGANLFDANSIPLVWGTGIAGTGARSFATNESGVIYFNDTGAAPTFDPTNRITADGTPIK